MNRAVPFAIVAVVVGATLFSILSLNDGRFVYSLDDAYIHLALSEGIAHGHYGVNPGEVSSPSSSILWPLLLAPFAGTWAHEYVPLALNFACLAWTILVLQGLAARVLDRRVPDMGWQRGILALAMVAAFNLVGLAFTGMEHGLQVLLALGLAYGLIVESEEGRFPPWLPLVILLGPLVRYEGLALSGAALLYISLRGRTGLAFGLLLLTLAPLVVFSYFLKINGLEWLPASVLIKAGLAVDAAGVWPSVLARLEGVPAGLDDIWAAWGLGLIGLAILGLGLTAARRSNPALAAALGLALLAQVLLGRFGWFARYEVYALAAGAAALLHGWREELRWFFRRQPGWRGSTAVLAAVLVLAAPYWRASMLTPVAANNIYQQQYQLHRLVTEFAPGPAAVNDLGWVSYRNPSFALDLTGLGSPEAFALARRGGAGWQKALVARHGIALALLYRDWARPWLPEDWVPLGRIRLGRERVTPARAVVDIYATSGEAAQALAPKMAAFAASLPPGVRFEGGR